MYKACDTVLTTFIYLFCWFCGNSSHGLLGKVPNVCACSINRMRGTILTYIVVSLVYSNTTHIYLCCDTLVYRYETPNR